MNFWCKVFFRSLCTCFRLIQIGLLCYSFLLFYGFREVFISWNVLTPLFCFLLILAFYRLKLHMYAFIPWTILVHLVSYKIHTLRIPSLSPGNVAKCIFLNRRLGGRIYMWGGILCILWLFVFFLFEGAMFPSLVYIFFPFTIQASEVIPPLFF